MAASSLWQLMGSTDGAFGPLAAGDDSVFGSAAARPKGKHRVINRIAQSIRRHILSRGFVMIRQPVTRP
jgi:hypothetical protein